VFFFFAWRSHAKTMITILGPTASGKTALAVAVARACAGEIISADSRQVYDRLFLGVGKDLDTYTEGGTAVPYHLIGHVPIDSHYDLFSFNQDFQKAKEAVLARGRTPVLCGGTGLYLESVLLNYNLQSVPEDGGWRHRAAEMTDAELLARFESLEIPHNQTAEGDRSRLIRAIEIAAYIPKEKGGSLNLELNNGLVFGLAWDPEVLRERIRLRLAQRLNAGMLEEVAGLLSAGVSAARLDQLGLEYRYCLRCLSGEISEENMVHLLAREICRYAKRQRTWFRRMEKRGVSISWISGDWSLSKQETYIKKMVETKRGFL